MKDLFPPKDDSTTTLPVARKIVATYDYFDEQGNRLFQVVRYEPKGFRVRRMNDDNKTWTWNLDGVRLVLYNLNDILQHPGWPVVICNGEKDADNLCQLHLNMCGTTNPGGEGKPWRDEYSRALRHRDCIVLVDNDDTGWRHAHEVAGSLMVHGARSIQVICPSTMFIHADLSDWLEAGHTARDFCRLMECATRWLPYESVHPLAQETP